MASHKQLLQTYGNAVLSKKYHDPTINISDVLLYGSFKKPDYTIDLSSYKYCSDCQPKNTRYDCMVELYDEWTCWCKDEYDDGVECECCHICRDYSVLEGLIGCEYEEDA